MTSAERLSLSELLAALREQAIAPEQSAQLKALLRDHAEARERYLEYQYLCASLHWLHDDEAVEQASVPVPVQVPVAVLAVGRSGGFVFRGRTTLAVSACAAAFALYVVVIAWGMLDGKDRGARIEARGSSSSPASDLAPRASQLAPAYVVASENATWLKQPQAGPPAASAANQPSIAKGEPLELASGVVELKLKQGVTLLVEGPAEWTIDGQNNATLKRGKLVASVPKQAVGFTLKTPTAQIVDLGTEFQVEVKASGDTDLEVRKGKVDFMVPTALASGDQKRTLVAGQRQRAGASGFVGDVSVAGAAKHPPSRAFGPKHVEQGGTFAPNNLAQRDEAKAFASDVYQRRESAWQHQISYLNDGRYGNRYSWIGDTGKPAFAGIRFGGKFMIESIAFGRDNGDDQEEGGVNRDRCAGTYTLQVTTVENPNEQTPDSDWRTLGTITHFALESEYKFGIFKPYLRHRYQFAPTEATGIRLLVPGSGPAQGTAIDEIEAYEASQPSAPQPKASSRP